MSVFYREERQSYEYEFQWGGHRYAKRGFATKAEAVKAEQARREQVKCDADKAQAYRDSLVLRDVADKYYEEHGKFQKAAPDTLRDLCRIVRWFEEVEKTPGIEITQIADAHINRLVAWRRGHKIKRTERLISNAGVNRSTTEVLRKVFMHARDIWHVRFDKWPNWDLHLLSEPKERNRPLYADEAQALADNMREDYLPAIRFALASGLRRIEIVNLKWDNVKWAEGVIVLQGKTGKDGQPKQVRRVITNELRDILWPLQGHHPEFVFTYVARARGPAHTAQGRAHRTADFVPKAAKAGQIVGQHYPITYSGFKTEWRRLKVRAKLSSGATSLHFHDLRHDYAGHLWRAARNPRIVQHGMSHDDFASTMKYTHADDAEIRQAAEAASAARRDNPLFKSPVQSPVQAVAKRGKSLE